MPKTPLTIEEKQQRALLRKLARDTGKKIARQATATSANMIHELHQYQNALQRYDSNYDVDHYGLSDPTHSKARLLAEAIRSVTSVVRASFGVDQPIEYRYINDESFTYNRPLRAYTDFKAVHIEINLGHISDFSDFGIRRTTALLKGATYHEVAHCMWTKAWGQVTEGYQFPDGERALTYQYAWNLLEDGRIETLLVNKSPIIRNYLLPLVYDVVVNVTRTNIITDDEAIVQSMPFLVVRSYLPKGLRRSAMTKCVEAGRDLSVLRDMNEVSRQYQSCDSWDAQIPLVIQFHELLKKWESNPDGLPGFSSENVVGDHGDSTYGEPVLVPVPANAPNEWSQDDFDSTKYEVSKSDDNGNSDQSDNAPDTDQAGDETDHKITEKSSQTSNGEQTKPADSDSKPGQAGADSGDATGNVGGQSELKDQLDQSLDKAVSDHELNEVISKFNKEVNRRIKKVATGNGATLDAKISDDITTGMINVLDSIVVTADPSWAYRQQDGVILDTEAFVTREIGDDRFWIERDGTGERGHDLAVSLLLDCSGSMDNHLNSLSYVAYAIRRACDYFSIPCSTLLFGSTTRTLWDADEDPKLVELPSLGGTSIGNGLLDIPEHRYGKRNHLVIILTDGAWSDVNSIRPFLKDGEVSLVVGFHIPVSYLSDLGADSVVTISNLLDLPSEVEKAIARFFV